MKLTISSSRLGCDLFRGASAVISSMASAEAYRQNDLSRPRPQALAPYRPVVEMNWISHRQSKHPKRKLDCEMTHHCKALAFLLGTNPS